MFTTAPPPVPFLSQKNPDHIPSFYFLEIHFNIIRPLTSAFVKGPRSFRILLRESKTWFQNDTERSLIRGKGIRNLRLTTHSQGVIAGEWE
jgi:hypothetical protein